MPSPGTCVIYLRHSVICYTTKLTPDKGGSEKIIRVSLSEPHISETALCTSMCMLTCVLVAYTINFE